MLFLIFFGLAFLKEPKWLTVLILSTLQLPILYVVLMIRLIVFIIEIKKFLKIRHTLGHIAPALFHRFIICFQFFPVSLHCIKGSPTFALHICFHFCLVLQRCTIRNGTDKLTLHDGKCQTVIVTLRHLSDHINDLTLECLNNSDRNSHNFRKFFLGFFICRTGSIYDCISRYDIPIDIASDCLNSGTLHSTCFFSKMDLRNDIKSLLLKGTILPKVLRHSKLCIGRIDSVRQFLPP